MALRRLGLLRGATDLLRLLGAADGGDPRECVDGLRRDPHLLWLADRHRLSLPSQTANQNVGSGRNSVSALQGNFWGDVSEETDYIFTKCRLVYIINFVDLWSK